MKRALIVLALLCGCGSSVTLGSFASDGGVGDMTCIGCDRPDFSKDSGLPSGSSDLGPSDLGPSDLGPSDLGPSDLLASDLALTFDLH
jgi:hypothetical protein